MDNSEKESIGKNKFEKGEPENESETEQLKRTIPNMTMKNDNYEKVNPETGQFRKGQI